MNEESWLFIEATQDEYNRLTGLPVLYCKIEHPFITTGIAFPFKIKLNIFEKLNLSFENYVPFTNAVLTDVTDTYYLKPVSSSEIEYWDNIHRDSWPLIKPILDQYGTMLNTKFKVSCPHGNTRSTRETEGVTYILFWSIPDGNRRYKQQIHSAFGVALGGEGQRDGFKPSNNGFIIYDNDDNALAEIHGNNLYILFDLLHVPNNVDTIMKEIMSQYYIAKTDPDILEKFMEELKDRELARSRVSYVEACSKRGKAQKEGIIRSLRDLEAQVVASQRVIAQSLIRLKENKLALLNVDQTVDTEFYAREFDKIFQLPGIENIVVDSDNICVFTDTVKIIEPFHENNELNAEYTIGKFKICIGIQPSSLGQILCFNINGERSAGYDEGDREFLQHPHIRRDGQCCFGNLSEGIAQLIAEFQFSIVIQMVLQFLHSYNREDCYGKIHFWKHKVINDNKKSKTEKIKESVR